jgi:hypothetical protein
MFAGPVAGDRSGVPTGSVGEPNCTRSGVFEDQHGGSVAIQRTSRRPTRGDPMSRRPQPLICISGVATYLVFLLAVIAGGDVEGGIPAGTQAVWQTVWIAAMVAAVPVLITGGALMLLRRTPVRTAP